MAYTTSQAQSGFGATLEINTGSIGSPTWTVVEEVLSIRQSSRATKDVTTTNLQSVFEEFLPTIPSSGTYDFTANRVSGATGQNALEAAFDAASLKQFRITLPKTATQVTNGDRFSFLALVQEFDPTTEIGPDKAIVITGKLKVSGAITPTAGA